MRRTGWGRKREGLAALVVATFVLPVTVDAQAQPRWTLDVRGSAAIPTADVEGHELGTGFGGRATLGYRILARTGAYVDWDWHAFAPDRSFAGGSVGFEESGFTLGIGLRRPLRADDAEGPALGIRAGGTYNHVELEDSRGREIADSGYGLGWEAGAGLDFGISESVRVTPGLRYRSFSRPVQIESTRTEVGLRYVSLDLGVSFEF
jgi:hypothetical protein